MLAVFKSLTKLWVILLLLFIGVTYSISLLYKSEPPPPPNYKVEGIEVEPNTIFCVSATAMVDGGCLGKTRADCEMLIRKYEAGCYPEDSQHREEVMQRMSVFNENSQDER